MHATIKRWRADFTEPNRRAAWTATGLVAQDEMATFAAHARNATLTADGVLPDEVVKQMWHTVADLERAHAATLHYFRQLEQTELPDQTTARNPLQPATLNQ